MSLPQRYTVRYNTSRSTRPQLVNSSNTKLKGAGASASLARWCLTRGTWRGKEWRRRWRWLTGETGRGCGCFAPTQEGAAVGRCASGGVAA